MKFYNEEITLRFDALSRNLRFGGFTKMKVRRVFHLHSLPDSTFDFLFKYQKEMAGKGKTADVETVDSEAAKKAKKAAQKKEKKDAKDFQSTLCASGLPFDATEEDITKKEMAGKRKRADVETVDSGAAKKAKRATREEEEKDAKDCQFTLCVSGLPLYATEEDMEDFFGMLLDTHMIMNKDGNGMWTKLCYAKFDDEALALKALNEKNNALVCGRKVRVEKSSVTLKEHKKSKDCYTIRQLPYDIKKSARQVEAVIRNEYKKEFKYDFVNKVVVKRCCPKSPWAYKYALVTFDGPAAAQDAMKIHENTLRDSKSDFECGATKTKEIQDYIKNCKPHKYW